MEIDQFYEFFNVDCTSFCEMSFSLPQVRTIYGKFNIRFTDVKVWNSRDDKLKTLKESSFKKKLKDSLIASYITS